VKGTSLPWAASLPDHWRVAPLKRVCAFHTGWTPPTGDADSYLGDNLWANISDLGAPVLYDTTKRLSDEAVRRHGMRVSPAGSLLFSFKLSVGQVSFAGVDMYTNEAIATFLPGPAIDLRFAYYAFPEMIVRNASENIYGAKMLNQQLINSAAIVFPPFPEQAAIAAFLDRETAKIDALVNQQRRLIDLLEEKRQTVISHAVTKGLDPIAEMKPSGVEWLGDVPGHWQVSRLSRLARDGTTITYGIVQAGPDTEGGVPYIRTSDMSGEELPKEGYLRTTPEIDRAYARSRVQPGDVVIAIRATIGKPLIVPVELAGANLTRGTAKFSPGSAILAEYVCHFLRSTGATSEFARLAKGATFKEITLEMLRKFAVPCPPIAEQQSICSWLEGSRHNLLVRDATRAIELLQERRASLITAAVTGKIDLRNFAYEREVA